MSVPDVSAIVVGRVVVPLLSPSLGAAFKEHDEDGEEQDDGGSEDEPDGRGEICRASGFVVDLVFDDPKDDEIKDHGYERDDECEESDERGADEAYSVGAQGNDGCEKGETEGDGMEDECVGQAIEGVVGPLVIESGTGCGGEVVSDSGAGTLVVVGLGTRASARDPQQAEKQSVVRYHDVAGEPEAEEEGQLQGSWVVMIRCHSR